MSIEWMNRVWTHSNQTGSALLLLLAIADHANDDGVCWPSVARLAQRARVKERQAQNIIKELAASGEIEIQHGAGRSHTSIYIIRLGITDGEKVQSTAPIKAKEKGAIQRQKVQSSTEKVQSSTVKGAVDCTRSIIEPPLESSSSSGGDNNQNVGIGKVFAAWQDNVPGTMTLILKDKLTELFDECGPDAIIHGISAGVMANARNFNYIATCARNHAAGVEPTRQIDQRNGGKYGKHRQNGAGFGLGGHGSSPRAESGPDGYDDDIPFDEVAVRRQLRIARGYAPAETPAGSTSGL